MSSSLDQLEIIEKALRCGVHAAQKRRSPFGRPKGRFELNDVNHACRDLVEMGESRTPRPEPSAEDQLRACPMIYRRAAGLPSAASRSFQSRPLAGFTPDYVTLIQSASPLNDASTAHGEEAASTLTLPPKRRGQEQAGGCQLLRFAACLTRPDGTSARVPRGSGPVETTHPQTRIVPLGTPVRVQTCGPL
jgi:hypothetical protein